MDAEILIIGAGTMDLATADALLSRGVTDVLLVDSHCPPHNRGSHHGHSRLIRVAYGEGSRYVQLARDALQHWQALDGETTSSVYQACGVLNIGHEDDSFLSEVYRSSQQFDLSVEHVTAAQVHDRWPGWTLYGHQNGCLGPSGGVLFSEPVLETWRRRVENAVGGQIITDAAVVEITRCGDSSFVVKTADGRLWSAHQVLFSAGRATAPLAAQLDVVLPLQRLRKTFAWYEADYRYQPSTFPGFSFTDDLGDYYGFPDLDGLGVKIGRHDGGQVVGVNADLASFGTYEEDMADTQQLIDRYLPGVGALREGAVCEYICTPDGDFILDEALPGLFVAAGFSGHGFKFAPAIGHGFAQWMTSGKQPGLLSGFQLDRF